MLPVTIRPARETELSQVLALWQQAAVESSVTDELTSLFALLNTDAEALLVAETGGRIVGTLIAAWDGWRGAMYRLAVLPDHRRRGIGRQLVAAGEQRLTSKGAKRIHALVLERERPGLEFWEVVGYDHHRGMRRYVKIGSSEEEQCP